MGKEFNKVLYDLDSFVYGKSLYPVKLKNGLEIGGGLILPELNFTLPNMLFNESTFPKVIEQYRSIIDEACKRAVELSVPGFVAEVELLPDATYRPEWGIEITKVVREVMYEYEQKHQLKSGLRLTPVDIREDLNSEHMWHGEFWDKIMRIFEEGAKAGADFLSIESIGGKDVHDEAIMYCNIKQSIFGLGVLGCMDMKRLWGSITEIAEKTGTVSAGDTACGFANTAMVLADRGYIPKVFAAVIRVLAVVRSLVAYEEGAVGPHKDCGYEGVYIKAITGTPISMEGKTSACAHLSPVGNIAAAVADLWSNESVQNLKLLGGMAPTVYMEQLAYDCRLMNTATKKGHSAVLLLRDLLTDSDSYYDPQAYVLRPDVVLKLSAEILKGKDHFERTKLAGLAAIRVLREAYENKEVLISEREVPWLDMLQNEIESIPADVNVFTQEMIEGNTSAKFEPKKYDL
ncbi:methyltransferase MtaB domain-containing protein [Anaerotalea alkaliphila]|uniref:Methanol--corrinoid methyltransferase n=1 Tax=Anaerotalea alkaliphila TaxID=2662126 RepID=A0A7X5KMZ8_9FIRM|nr:methyltransferase MtaB domain-containing protein [Anaerotalea alkaliphila]NDL68344.1 methanol--corrinoid methyltransferase [Anaerotalea alkaliphila]